MFCWRWIISKYCRKKCSLVFYAKRGNQAILTSIFSRASDLPVSLGKSIRPSVSSSFNCGWSPILFTVCVCGGGQLWVGKYHWKFKPRLTTSDSCLSVSPVRKPDMQSMTKTLNWLRFLLLYLWKEVHASKSGIKLCKALGTSMYFDWWFTCLPSSSFYCNNTPRNGRLGSTGLTTRTSAVRNRGTECSAEGPSLPVCFCQNP